MECGGSPACQEPRRALENEPSRVDSSSRTLSEKLPTSHLVGPVEQDRDLGTLIGTGWERITSLPHTEETRQCPHKHQPFPKMPSRRVNFSRRNQYFPAFRFPNLFPPLKPETVARRTVEAMQQNQALLLLPWTMNILIILKRYRMGER